MRAFAFIAALAWPLLRAAAADRAPLSPFQGGEVATPTNEIDRRVFRRLEKLGIPPAPLCSDAVFVRRVYLDAIGTLPAAHQAKEFLLDRRPNKRRVLIDHLLERDEFADYWAMKWCDLLRVKAEFPINLWPNAAQAYHRWIRAALKDNVPYDRFVREMLTASGSNFRVPQVNFYRAVQSKEPQAIAQAVALTFMGVRPETWSREQWSGLAAFFAQVDYKSTAEWKEEIVFFNPEKAKPADIAATAAFPDGTRPRIPADRDPRAVFADWLVTPHNPWFTRNIANRVWSWLLGRGIIHEPDDLRPDNTPSQPELLAWLEQELAASRYDLKHLFRQILNSQTYQLASVPRAPSPEGAACFAHYPVRRLEAEVLIDALCLVTASTEKYSSPIPEPFTYIPEDQRSIALPDGSITSPFLELFGRPARDTGLESERNNRPTAAQRLHLLNSSHIQRKIEQSRIVRFLSQPNHDAREIVDGLYLAILSRFPTQHEFELAQTYSPSGTVKGRETVVDLAWALINSPEFLCRH